MTEWTQIVHSDPEIMGGELVFVGTRVPLYNLFDYLEAGDSLEEFLEQFPSVSREQAAAALELSPSVVLREWGEEIERRARRVLSGESMGEPWEDVRDRIEKRLKR